MCKLCERDKPKEKYYHHNEWTEVMNDRLAVLEKDHAKIPKLVEIIKMIKDKHSVEHRHRHSEFPSTTSLCKQANAILGVKEE